MALTPEELLKSYSTSDLVDYNPEQLYSTFRYFRNLCTEGTNVRSQLCRSDVFNHALIIIDKIIKSSGDRLLPPLKQGLQFIHNLSVNCIENKDIIWSKYSCLKEWIAIKKDKDVCTYIWGTLYNVVQGSAYLHDAITDPSLIDLLFESAAEGVLFAVLFIENLFEEDEYIEEFFSIMSQLDCRYFFYFFELLHDYVKEKSIRDHFINVLKKKYVEKVRSFVSDSSNTHIQEIFPLLVNLIEISSKDDKLHILQRDIELLDVTKSFLELIHNKGKDRNSEFAPTEEIFPARIATENLKSNLIRLIANLCWLNREMQDRVRETGGLTIILDSCVRDGRNPFITETCIYAIRNLCQLNDENQSIIYALNCDVHHEIVQRMKNRSRFNVPSMFDFP